MSKGRILRYFTIFTILVGLFVSCTPSALADDSIEIWDGSVASQYSGGSGTKDDPYIITNGAQLALVGGWETDLYYVIKNDIYLNDVSNFSNWENQAPSNIWIPNRFNSNIDGGNHTIYGLYTNKDEDYQGLFSQISISATIKNIRIEKSYLLGVNQCGSIVGRINNSTDKTVLIDNCQFSGIMRVTGYYNGGLVGMSYGAGRDNNQIIISNCANHADIANTNKDAVDSNDTIRLGGIIGQPANGTTVDSCANYGNIGGYSSQVGGIAGLGWNYSIIKNCINYGDVITSGSSDVAGIVGNFHDDSGIYNCINVGNIHGEYRTAGICASVYERTDIKNVLNAGNVTNGSNEPTYAVIGYYESEDTRVNCLYVQNTGIQHTTEEIPVSPEAYSDGTVVAQINEWIQQNQTPKTRLKLWAQSPAIADNAPYLTDIIPDAIRKDNEYRLSSLVATDLSGNTLDSIPDDKFLISLKIENICSKGDTMVVIATYNELGQYEGVMYFSVEDLTEGTTFKVSLLIDNQDGSIKKIQAFSIESFSRFVPIGNTVSI